jgi:hypothetical protein
MRPQVMPSCSSAPRSNDQVPRTRCGFLRAKRRTIAALCDTVQMPRATVWVTSGGVGCAPHLEFAKFFIALDRTGTCHEIEYFCGEATTRGGNAGPRARIGVPCRGAEAAPDSGPPSRAARAHLADHGKWRQGATASIGRRNAAGTQPSRDGTPLRGERDAPGRVFSPSARRRRSPTLGRSFRNEARFKH